MVSFVKHLLMATAVMGLLGQAAVAESLTQPDPTSVGGANAGMEKTRYIDSDGLQLGSRPFSWNEEDGLRDLGDLPEALSEGGAWAIRSNGIIAGYSSTAPYGGAFLWRPEEGMISLGDLPGGGDQSRANDLNDREEVVGWASADDGKRAFLWTGVEGLQDLNALAVNLPEDVVLTDARAIGPLGNIVGTARTPEGDRAFLWHADTGEFELIEGIEGVVPRTAIAMSSIEHVLVQTETDRGLATYIWSANDGLRPVDGKVGDTLAIAHDVNAGDDAVGLIGEGDARRAVLWHADGEVVDLTSSVVDLPEGLTLDSAMAINDLGQIAVYGHFGAPAHHLFVLTPEDLFVDGEAVIQKASFPGVGRRYRLTDLGEVLVDGVDMPPVGIDELGEIAGQCELTAAACPYLSEHFGEVEVVIDDDITNLFLGGANGPTFSPSSSVLGLGSDISAGRGGAGGGGLSPQLSSGGPGVGGGSGSGGRGLRPSFSDPFKGSLVVGGGSTSGGGDKTPATSSPVPLPAGIWLMLMALGGLIVGRARQGRV
ncbi:hypothetical protein GCM10011324_16190 [Allosediminivita pacifica]|uniref:Putative secreted protein n=1 Tax=Allosediminivita pacifica TaxID=1267769 RepID=A0A2T6AG50_9RHOB|nr:putative secreted protein [Allosediminivita pacifica]GGB06847.1 hypothetical protein GCM10011324_16190 [Allosediminivita pacifica]